jgi:hypothetical protein
MGIVKDKIISELKVKDDKQKEDIIKKFLNYDKILNSYLVFDSIDYREDISTLKPKILKILGDLGISVETLNIEEVGVDLEITVEYIEDQNQKNLVLYKGK